MSYSSLAFIYVWSRSKPKLALSSPQTFSSFGKTILEDESTADFTIRCETKSFRVHKTVLCARSPVFRASILTDMEEARKGEIFVKEINEKSLATIIQFVYTGELELGKDPDILMLAWAGNMYLLPGFMDLLALKVRKLDLSGRMIADLLITAYRHEAGELRMLALHKTRANREIFSDPGFRMGMEKYPDILMDLLKCL